MKLLKTCFAVFTILVSALIVFFIVWIAFFFDENQHERSPQTSCLSNEKQMGLAFQQYTQDYDGKMPSYQFHPGSNNTVSGTGWIGPLFSYIKSTEMLKCPQDPNTVTQVGSINYVPVSYAINSNTAINSSEATYTDPSKTVALFEVTNVNADVTDMTEKRTTGATQISAAGNGINTRLSSSVGALPTTIDPVRYATGEMDNSAYPSLFDQYADQPARHKGGSNFLMMDGHAKWFKPKDVSAGGTALMKTNVQSALGCAPDGSQNPGAFPCAEGTANGTHPATFSVN